MQLISKRAGRVAAVCGLLVLMTGAQEALAYPQFQLSTINGRCNLCHVSPAGGGLINAYGRDEAEGTISKEPGNSRFLHGLWQTPDWLVLGGDLRGATVVKRSEGQTQALAFPMQADLYARAVVGSVSINAVVGMSGAARGTQRTLLERIASREHYVMWQPEETGYYARAGRFFAPFGLRVADHTAYVRRHMGQHTFEETYNLSAGRIEDDWEAHATAFASPSLLGLGPLGKAVGVPAVGGALYYERRIRDETAAYGMQSKVAVADESTQYWLGGVGKLWLEDHMLLILSELDVGVQTFAFDADPRMQVTAHVGLTYFLKQGWLLGTTLEHHDPDVFLAGTARDSLNVTVQYFFRSHWELMLLGKVDVQGLDSAAPMTMLMLHYYL